MKTRIIILLIVLLVYISVAKLTCFVVLLFTRGRVSSEDDVRTAPRKSSRPFPAQVTSLAPVHPSHKSRVVAISGLQLPRLASATEEHIAGARERVVGGLLGWQTAEQAQGVAEGRREARTGQESAVHRRQSHGVYAVREHGRWYGRRGEECGTAAVSRCSPSAVSVGQSQPGPVIDHRRTQSRASCRVWSVAARRTPLRPALSDRCDINYL